MKCQVTSTPPSAVFARFSTKFRNYRTLFILDNASVNSRGQDPLPLGAHGDFHSITTTATGNCISRSSSLGQDPVYDKKD